MGPNDKDRARFVALQSEADIALQAVREARAAVTAAYAACVRGEGLGPTDAQLVQAEQLERNADAKAVQVKAFLQHLFP